MQRNIGHYFQMAIPSAPKATSYSTLFGKGGAINAQSEGLGWSSFMLGRWSPN